MSKINNTFKNINNSIFSALKESAANEASMWEKQNLKETGEWDDEDEEMQAWLEDLRGQAQELANQIGGEVKSVTGFDAYQGPRAVVHSPKHGDVIMWFDQEDDTGRSFNVKVAHVGWITGGINNLADLLNQDTIPENEILSESSLKEWKDGGSTNQYAITFYINSNLSEEELEARTQEVVSVLEDDEMIERPIKEVKVKKISEIHRRLPESSLNEERANMVVHKGDVFENQNGIKCTIVDVDNEHTIEGEPQVMFRFTSNSSNTQGETTKTVPMKNVVRMLNQNGYRKEI